ncbi:MAG: NCS2 family permease [Gammaproteobacteria bacterium]|nr:NCS2 family permease [Gammaproteobacteria bacterium]
MTAWLEQRFRVSERGSSLGREVTAGCTTFLAMAYIAVVNPAILADAGMDFGAVFVATCLAAAVGTAVMGLAANYPVALAPGMGQNAFFAYTVVLASGQTWQAALGMVFVSGVLFVALSVLPARAWLMDAMPRGLKAGTAAGIGLFLAFIALRNAGIVVASPATLVELGDLTTFPALAAIAGFCLIVALFVRQIPGALVIGILAVAAVAWLTGEAEFHGVASLPPSPAPVLLALDISAALSLTAMTIVLAMLLVDVFDTLGTLVAVGARSRLLDAEGRLPRLRRALLADSTATVFGSLVGTSSTTSYIESAAGVESGGRTGLTAMVVAALFLACLWLAPLAESVPGFASAAALLFVACLMARSFGDLEWDDTLQAVPGVATAICIPLSFSIADGIGIGFITCAAIHLFSGRMRECSVAVYLVAGIFALKFALLT